MRRLPVFFCLPILMWTAFPGSVFAHAIGVSCMVRGEKVEIEAYYDDDSPAAQAKVQVVDAKDQTIATGVTDKDGKCYIALPGPGKYEVRVDAGAGHRATTTLRILAPKRQDQQAPSVTVDESKPVQTGSSDGPSRSDFTRFPWDKIAIGLIVIAGLGGAFVLASRMRKKPEMR